MKAVVVLGRFLYSLIFIISGAGHFNPNMAEYAAQHGVPLASLLVPIAGLIAIAGGLSVMLGFRARWGAVLLIIFLVPVTVMIHSFWNVADPMQAQTQQAMFLKNLSMLGAALLIFNFGAGPVSFDEQAGRR